MALKKESEPKVHEILQKEQQMWRDSEKGDEQLALGKMKLETESIHASTLTHNIGQNLIHFLQGDLG